MAFYDNTLFNSIDLNAISKFEIDRVDIDIPPEPVISSAKLARKDGSKLYNKEYGSKTIIIEGHFTASSRAEYVTARDTLLRYLEPQEATLQVPIGNNPRLWTATVSNSIFSDSGGGFGRVTVNFLCSDPFGYELNARTIINGTTTTSASNAFSLSETIAGSYKSPPYIRLTVVAIDGGTGKYIDLANEAGDSIRITRDWVLNDVLTVDMKLKEVRVNSALVDYIGTFWDLSPDDDSITYSDNFTTSRTVSLIATYKRRFL